MSRRRIAVLSVTPSPYQRDLLGALALRPGIDLRVFYQERRPHDSPWPDFELARHEKILPGFYLKAGAVRSHVNWSLPGADDFDLWIVNTALTSITGQWMMRCGLRGRPWLFWGERLRGQKTRLRSRVQETLAAPLAHAAGIIGIGTWAQEDYAGRFPKAKSFMTPYCTRLDDFFAADRDARGKGDVVFLFCGQMIPRKGIDLLLNAFERLVREGRPVRLRLVGREAGLPPLLAALPEAARARVDYEGFQPPEALPRFFATADVFILPSRHDGWGVVVNQALAAGLPVLCSDAVGAARDCVENGVNGLVFPADDGEAVYGAMREVMERRAVLPEWGAASAAKASGLTPESGAQRLEEAIETVLGENGGLVS